MAPQCVSRPEGWEPMYTLVMSPEENLMWLVLDHTQGNAYVKADRRQCVFEILRPLHPSYSQGSALQPPQHVWAPGHGVSRSHTPRHSCSVTVSHEAATIQSPCSLQGLWALPKDTWPFHLPAGKGVSGSKTAHPATCSRSWSDALTTLPRMEEAFMAPHWHLRRIRCPASG